MFLNLTFFSSSFSYSLTLSLPLLTLFPFSQSLFLKSPYLCFPLVFLTSSLYIFLGPFLLLLMSMKPRDVNFLHCSIIFRSPLINSYVTSTSITSNYKYLVLNFYSKFWFQISVECLHGCFSLKLNKNYISPMFYHNPFICRFSNFFSDTLGDQVLQQCTIFLFAFFL